MNGVAQTSSKCSLTNLTVISSSDSHTEQVDKCGPVRFEKIYQNTGDVPVMSDKELARLRHKLVERVSRELINQLLDDLLEDGVLNDGEKDSILQENSNDANRARRLIDMIRKKGRKASRKLLTHLQSRDPMLCAELGLPSGLPV
ncbi:caspase recruitment domain-containing protein 18-like [Epinephelus lanceolatus]